MTIIQCIMAAQEEKQRYGYMMADTAGTVQYHLDDAYYLGLINRNLYRAAILEIWGYDIDVVFGE